MFKTLYLKYSFVINFILGLLNYLELRSVVQGCQMDLQVLDTPYFVNFL